MLEVFFSSRASVHAVRASLIIIIMIVQRLARNQCACFVETIFRFTGIEFIAIVLIKNFRHHHCQWTMKTFWPIAEPWKIRLFFLFERIKKIV